MVSKKRAGGRQAAPPPRRLRVVVSGGSSPEPPSPQQLFLPAPVRGRSADRVSRIARMEKELGRLRHGIKQQHDALGTLLRDQEYIKKLIHGLASKLDNIKGPSPNHHIHECLMQGINQEGTNAEDEGSADTENEGKDTRIRLRFHSEMKPPIYHDDEIKSIRIGIFNGGTIIQSGQLSKLKIEVLALEGNFPYNAQDSWTSKEFNEHIACGRDGKGNVLGGKGTNAQLINGECHLDSIRFKESSCRARSGKFIVAARVRGGHAICDRVQEAVMNPVVVRDRRAKYHEKSNPPKPDDEVYRLEKIAINGKYHARLQNQNIRTVGHFLKALYKDENSLRKSLGIKPKSKIWNKMVDHAEKCSLEDKPELKSYQREKNVVLFFNYVHHLVGARFDSQFVRSEGFDQTQKNRVNMLKKNAYDQLDSLPWDYEMRDNIPVRIGMNTEGGAGPSCMTNRAPQQINSGHHIAEHQVGGTPASEALRLYAPPEPSCENAYVLSSIHDPSSTHNYQVGVLNESSIAIGNDGPSPSFSAPNHLLTQNYQDRGAGFAAQDHHNPVFDGMSLLGAQAIPFGETGVSGMRHIVHEAVGKSAYPRYQSGNNNCGAPILLNFAC